MDRRTSYRVAVNIGARSRRDVGGSDDIVCDNMPAKLAQRQLDGRQTMRVLEDEGERVIHGDDRPGRLALSSRRRAAGRVRDSRPRLGRVMAVMMMMMRVRALHLRVHSTTGAAADQVERVGQDTEHGLEVLDGAFGRAWAVSLIAEGPTDLEARGRACRSR